jgi:hypothetical protein
MNNGLTLSLIQRRLDAIEFLSGLKDDETT